MSINKRGIYLTTLDLPFLLLSCSEDPINIIDVGDEGGDENGEEQTEFIYAIASEDGDGVATFHVDMTDAADFDHEVYSVFITGSLIGLPESGTEPDIQTLVLIEGEDTKIPVITPDETGDIDYKYFSDAVEGFEESGWEGGEWAADPNRTATLEADAEIQDVWGDQPK